MAHSTRLIVLDRDGVLNQTVPNPREPRPDSPLNVDQVAVFPWVPVVLGQLTRAGYQLAVATNQPAYAKGKVSLDVLQAVHARVLSDAQGAGGVIHSSHICWHRAEDGCACRKPKPQLALDAIAQHPAVDLTESWMVGDRATDVIAGMAAGLQTALLADASGAEREALARAAIQPSFCGDDLRDFARFVLGPLAGISR
jgi:D-glycero-D-manno-heptose 1,7-bisphosphate phosphatase